MMGMPKAPRSFLEEIADYDNPAPPEFDPEQQDADQYGAAGNSSADDGSVDADEGREHYLPVGKSRLRGSDGIQLGIQYEGASVDRDLLNNEDGSSENGGEDPFAAPREDFDSNDEGSEADEEEIDEAVDDFGSDGDNDDDDGDMDEEKEMPKSFNSGISASADSEQEDSDSEVDDEGVFDDVDEQENMESVDSETTSPPPDQSDKTRTKDNRAALRKMMTEERGTVAARLSAAAKADIDKGRAIKQQRSTFDSLLNIRIKLQKALIATNSMTAANSENSASEKTDTATECASASRAAEEAALKLWRSLSSMRESLGTTSKKRPLPTSTDSSNQSLWNEAMSLETAAAFRRRSVLTKWSQRTNPSIALQPQNRLSQTPSQLPLTSVLDRQLSGEGMERALKRTRLARSCAPLQAASKTLVEDERIYDDADFYTMLLRELIDQRMDDSRTSSSTVLTTDGIDMLPNQRELKVKKEVDTKASKGRKIRYTVHEKLQNFMVADDRGSWGERQRAELFDSLLGKKVEMREDEEIEEGGGNDDEEAEEAMEVEGLKLFGR